MYTDNNTHTWKIVNIDFITKMLYTECNNTII